jgi:ferrous iron transport protein B
VGRDSLDDGAPASAERSRVGWVERLTTHRVLGLPLFLAAMWLAFKLTTDVSAPFVDWIDAVVAGPLYRNLVAVLEAIGLGGSWLESLLADGLLLGVGAVLAFVPVLLSLYLALAVLEHSGYLARGAHIMDGVMRLAGLPGRAFLPMMLGFGCSVPALLALRSLDRKRDRVLAGLLVPFMSCGARLPVYVLMATAFFVGHRTLAVFSMYLLGLGVAVLLGTIVGRTLLRGNGDGDTAPVSPMPLSMPSWGDVMSTVRTRTVDFLRDAGTVILGASLVVWLLMAIPIGSGSFADADVEDSAFATVSRIAAPPLEPLGLGDWRQSGALLTGLVAKEVVVATLAQGYGLAEAAPDDEPGLAEDAGEIVTGFAVAVRDSALALPGIVGIDLDGGDGGQSPALIGAVRRGFEESSGGRGAAAALAFMVFVLLYTPCAASLATTRRELGTRWMWASGVGQLLLAWAFAFFTYRIGVLVGLG